MAISVIFSVVSSVESSRNLLFPPLCPREILLFSISGQTEVYELTTEIE